MTSATVRGKLMAGSGCRVREDHQSLRGFMHSVNTLFSTPRSLFQAGLADATVGLRRSLARIDYHRLSVEKGGGSAAQSNV